MRKLTGLSLMLAASFTSITQAAIAFKDNSDIALTLSQNNYNRLVVKGDRIAEAHFPEHAMEIKRDEQDGSAYVALTATSPFTLFLTTEAGRHFSVTVTGEEGLGKTVELASAIPLPVAAVKKPAVALTKAEKADAYSQSIVDLITHMERRESIEGVNVSHHFLGRVERLGQGLMLTTKETWKGADLTGEIIEVTNTSTQPITLSQSWFSGTGVKAMQLSETTLPPNDKALLFRVRG